MSTRDRFLPSSFRDPSGYLFFHRNTLLRQVNKSYKKSFDHLVKSGLYEFLVKEGLLIPHKDVNRKHAVSDKAYKIIKPEPIDFISYPYEWCFSQLKDAALVTLKVQKLSLKYGMSLKDASGYNIQFQNGKPVLIDTLSFEIYRLGQSWPAYRQFCQHFLAPLALMSYKNVTLNQLLRIYIDGIPLSLASSLLPFKTYFKPSLLSHIHLHAKSQEYFGKRTVSAGKRKLSRQALSGLIDNLESQVTVLTRKPAKSVWGDYYGKTNYSPSAFIDKKKLVGEFLDKIKPKTVWDLGANTGVFSRIAARPGARVVSFDNDPEAVEINYREVKKKKESNLLPLYLDLTNPSPAIGWENKERASLFGRGEVECVLALAIIHHLAIANNVPLVRIAGFLSKLCQTLIIEFVPKEDSQVKKLLSSREDIFADYTREEFEKAFEENFAIKASTKIKGARRTLYLMRKKSR